MKNLTCCKSITILIIIFTTVLPIKALSENGELLCVHKELIIEPDMQMPETAFDEKNASKAREALKTLDSASEDTETQYAIQNNMKIIHGYQLKENALASRSNADIQLFCEFYIRKAYYYD